MATFATRATGASESGTLFVVGTPIGNLEDLTARAKRVLAEVSLVVAEDTRRTRQLLTHLDIHKPMLSVHGDTERSKAPQVLAALEKGDVAYCTDGGMPSISDPGAYLVGSAREAGFGVSAIPGPSAVTTALAVSGFGADRFLFLGFLPRKSSEMTRVIGELESERRTAVAFESPLRLVKALDIIAEVLPERRCAVTREMTKLHEEVRVGQAADHARYYRDHPAKGEVTLVIEGAKRR